MRKNLIGLDIGGTKCAVVYGVQHSSGIEIVDKIKFATTDVDTTIADILESIGNIIQGNKLKAADMSAVGISCGGPLDSKKGVVMSPPNLLGWDNIHIVKIIEEKFGIPTAIHNDANAGALAEWKFGAGRGCRNMIFLTFGTGMGGGMILDNKLYAGTNDNAGEFGHLRLSEHGPVGYGKSGSFEGFCSGGGIAQLAASLVKEKMQMGEKVSWCGTAELDSLTAQQVAEAAKEGDPLALKVFDISSRKLGLALSMMIDILNPEAIVIGSIYVRCRELIEPTVLATIRDEALPLAAAVCQIKPAELGEKIGDYAALSVAANII